MWGVLCGASQYVQHYVNIKKSPNAKFVFDTKHGFNKGSLKLVASTRNSAGISAGSEVVINYGAEFDMSKKRMNSAITPASKRFKGALDVLLQKQAECFE